MAPNKHQKHHAANSAGPKDKSRKKSKSIRQKIRDVRRLLQQPDIPATVRVAQERMLDLLQQSLKEKAGEDRERKMVKKYKMVKFFEKRKIARKYKTCLNELNTSTGDREQLQNELQLLKEQWNYVTYFPHNNKYISLYPPVPYSDESAVAKKQEEIMLLINEKVESKEIPDASDSIITSPESKKKKISTRKQGRTQLKVANSKAEKRMTSDDQTAVAVSPRNTMEDDDFFIDTSPGSSSEVPPQKSSNGIDAETSKHQFAVLGSVSESKLGHKVKRLKTEQETTRSRKNDKDRMKR